MELELLVHFENVIFYIYFFLGFGMTVLLFDILELYDWYRLGII